jgi:hypothetical protein
VSRRGQLVLLAAALVAVALLPLVAAYLQLGYHPAVQHGGDTPIATAERTLDRALAVAASGVPERYPWADRRRAVAAVERNLTPALTAVGAAGPPGQVRRVAYNASAARRVARRSCPAGPDRQFGPCEADGGIVLQSRAGRTHVVAAAVDLTLVGSEQSANATVVVWRRPRVGTP